MEALAVVAVLLAGAAVLFTLRNRVSQLGDEQFNQLAEQVRTELADAQSQALQRNSEQFLELAETRLKAETARGIQDCSLGDIVASG